MSVSRLGFIILGAAKPSEWETFGKDILGVMANTNEAGGVFLKIDDHPFRVMVSENEQDELLSMVWEVDGIEAYEEISAKLSQAGHKVEPGSEADAEKRCVSKFFRSTDPAGNNFEVYHKRTNVGNLFQSPLDVKEFVTGDMGMGHVVVPAPNLDETRDFYETFLGLQLSDDLTMPGAGEGAPDMRIYFFHANNPRHHSLALFNLPIPSKIVHFMFEVTSVDEVGKCLDRVNAANMQLMASLGRHCNDNMLSFYVFGPGGIPVEYGYDGLQIDFETYEPTVSTVADHWGHLYNMP